METITFYSYKGGVGRSLLLANMAHALALLDKKVLCLDLDLEAPGLHYKLLDSAQRKQITLGVPNFLTSIQEGRSDEIQLGKYTVEAAENLHVLPSVPLGPTVSSYWDDLARIDWHGSGASRFLKSLVYLQALVQRHGYDYLLIDSRTGVTDIGAIATTVLPGTVVVCTLASEECLTGTARVLEALEIAPQPILTAGRSVIRVVMRVLPPNWQMGGSEFALTWPAALESQALVSDFLANRSTLTDSESFSEFVVVREDASVRASERITLSPPVEALSGVGLDYLRVLRRIAPNVDASSLVDRVFKAQSGDLGEDVLTDAVAQLTAIAMTPLLMAGWLRLARQGRERGRPGLNFTTLALAALGYESAEGEVGRRAICNQLEPLAESVNVGEPIDARLVQALKENSIDLITSDGAPSPFLTERVLRLAVNLSPRARTSIAELMLGWDTDLALRLMARSANSVQAQWVRATLARRRGDIDAELQESLRGIALAGDAKRPAEYVRQLVTRSSLVCLREHRPAVAGQLSGNRMVRSMLPDEVVAALYYVAGDLASSRLWLARAVGRAEVEPNLERQRQVASLMLGVGAKSLIAEVSAAFDDVNFSE